MIYGVTRVDDPQTVSGEKGPAAIEADVGQLIEAGVGIGFPIGGIVIAPFFIGEGPGKIELPVIGPGGLQGGLPLIPTADDPLNGGAGFALSLAE